MCAAEAPMIDPRAAGKSVLEDAVRVEALSVLSCFRQDLCDCLTTRADSLFELADALLWRPTGR
jgi:hypothetical protein